MLRVFTAFSGYDSQCMALDRIGVDYDLVGWSEIDRFAIRAHDAGLQVGVTKESRHGSMPYRVYDSSGVCPTLDTGKGGAHTPKISDESHALRRLTPREYFRLMGVSEQDIDAIQAAGISDSQQYKMAGNSIVVDVLAKIFYQLFRFNEL